ncbi:MAG: 3-oxoacyl-[acyl-carrier protein] reductase, partial [uncultured Pseudonocardia sp.]
ERSAARARGQDRPDHRSGEGPGLQPRQGVRRGGRRHRRPRHHRPDPRHLPAGDGGDAGADGHGDRGDGPAVPAPALRHPRRRPGRGCGGQGAGLLRRPDRRAGQQRRRRRAGLHPGHARPRPGRGDRHDRQGPHARGQARRAGHDRPAQREDHQHLVGRDRLRARDAVALRGGQARDRGADLGLGVRARRARHQRQRGRPGDDPPGWGPGLGHGPGAGRGGRHDAGGGVRDVLRGRQHARGQVAHRDAPHHRRGALPGLRQRRPDHRSRAARRRRAGREV